MTASSLPRTFEFESLQLDSEGCVIERVTARASGERLALPGEVVLDLVEIPAGRFQMGASEGETGAWRGEHPRHAVELPAFELGRTSVTQAQWRAVALLPPVDRKLDPAPSLQAGHDRPVENIRWLAAAEFCSRLSRYTGRSLRLPSEAEWEYACRAGTTSPFHCGETLTPEVANVYSERSFANEAPRPSLSGTTPVASYPANAFGLHDMHGNVFEWCADAWHASYEDAPSDAKPWLEHGHPGYRPLRGGAWCTHPRGCRSAVRSAAHERSDHRERVYGLRVAAAAD